MKAKAFVILGSVFLSCMTTQGLAQFSQPVRVSEVIGCSIKGPQDQNLGTVRDLAVDLSNGRIVEVIAGRGGFLGIDRKFAAAPPGKFMIENRGNGVRVSLIGGTLAGAPAFDLSHWDEATTQAKVEDAYQYYGSTPYFLVPEHPDHGVNTVEIPMGEVERASRLIGAQTMNAQGEELGRVENLMVDVPQGRIVEVIFASGNFLGMPGELSAVPPQVLHFDASRDVVTLDTTREALANAPHFPSQPWPEINRDQASAVYGAYHVTPYFLPVGGNASAQNPGPSPADLVITAKIQKELLDTDGLSVDARAVKITAIDGRVTLRGMVDSQHEKQLVGEIAARVVPVADVTNLLEVEETASLNK